METAGIVAWTLVVYGVLKKAADGFHLIAEKTKTKTDDKISKAIGTGLSWMGKLIDLFTANTRP